MAKSWTAMGDTKPVNPSKQPKGTIFGAYAANMPKKMSKQMSKQSVAKRKKTTLTNAANKVMFGK